MNPAAVLVQGGMTPQHTATGMAAGMGTAAGGPGSNDPGDRRGGPQLIGPAVGIMAVLRFIENLKNNRYQDHEAPDDQNCELFPYKDRQTKCPNGNAHHVIPDHCWRPGSGIQKLLPAVRVSAEIDDAIPRSKNFYYYEKMNREEGYSICVDGGGKTGTHGMIHKLFDPAELKIGQEAKPPFPLYTGKLGDLEDAAAKAVFLATGCPEESIKQQLRKYHESKALDENKMLRADPFGKNTTSPTDYMADPVIKSGTGGKKF